jgi:hypothetical protein
MALGVLFYACGETNRTTDPSDLDPSVDSTPVIRNCLTNPVVFNHYVMDTAHIKVVAQIGSIGGGNTELIGRSYVFAKDGLQGQRLPIRAPADLEIVAAKRYLPPGAPTTGYIPDWSLHLDVGCGITIDMYHIKDVSDSLKAVADTTVFNSSAWEGLSRKVPVKAGEIIGWYIPGLTSTAWDFIVSNDSVTNQFVNQARYVARNSNILHTVCPYDFFEPSKRAAYYTKLGSVTGVPVPGADCGTVERDVIGTPSGQWFLDSTFVVGPGPLKKEGFYGDPFPNVIAPDSTVMFGHIGTSNDVRIARTNPTWKRPQDITTEWCYQIQPTPSTSDGWVWLKMVTSTKMEVAYGETGTCPTTFPTSGTKMYFR